MRTAHYTAQPVEAGAGGTQCRAAETSISYLLCPPAPCVSSGLSGPFPSRDDGQCAEAGHRLSPGHPATHISTSGCSKNAEGDISCSSRCVAALLKAAGIVREEKALPRDQKKKVPSTWTERKGGHRHCIYFYNPLFSHLPLRGILESKTDTCQDVRCPDKIKMILPKAGAERNRLQPLQRSKGQLGLGLPGWAIPRCGGPARCQSRPPAHAPADAWHMTLGQLVAAKAWPAHPLP